MPLIDQELEEICVETDGVFHHVLVLLNLLSFLEEDREAGKPVEPFWTEVGHLRANNSRVRLVIALMELGFAKLLHCSIQFLFKLTPCL